MADRWRIHQLREALIQSPSFWKRLWLFLILIGPGILVMIADNDAAWGDNLCSNRRRLRDRIFIPFLILMVPVAYEGSGHNRGIMVVDCCS
ncbi:hypothetical protein A4U49_09090 [Acidithiobacillus ferrivorans]|nr:hypothetical protein A4U49_09090 [Acidithiobacillus ferrivorans]